MPRFGQLLSGEKTVTKKILGISIGLTIVGIIIIVVGVIEHWGPTRFFGAGLISVGGILCGAAVGFSEPLRASLRSRLSAWRIRIAVAVAIVVGGPAVLATVFAAFGPLTGGGDSNDTLLVVVGALMGILIAAATIAAGVISVLAIQRRSGMVPRSASDREDGLT